ncbi:MAG: thioredoxin, partial [Butyricimonas faecalis]
MFVVYNGMDQSKNTSTEVKDYREVEGKIILEMVVNGVMADFVLDLAGHNAILPEYVEKLNIDPNVKGDFRYDTFQYKRVPVEKSVSIETISFGNSVFGNGVAAFVLKDEPYLRKLGVAGIVGGSLFRNVVLTIDSKRKKITMSNPYRPSYMKLD